MTVLAAISLDPSAAADALVDRHGADWLDAFSEALNRRRAGAELARILSVWGLSQSEAGRRFGVSRQAVSKWLSAGLPSDRVAAVADLSAATDLLVRYVKRDRIPALVRRRASALGGVSLLDLIEKGRYRDILSGCRSMFDFAGVQQ